MSERIPVVLIDDHTLFRKGLAELLEHGGKVSVLGVAANLAEARPLLEQHPKVILIDLHMPDQRGVAAIGELRAAGVGARILALTVSEAEEDMAAVLRAGANGYLLKSMEPDEVVDAIQRAARGEIVVAPAMTAKLVGMLSPQEPAAPSLLDQLTQREREILTHLSFGKSNKTIARELNISTETVKLHVRNVLAKLNLSSRVEAAVFAIRHKVDTPRD